MRPYTWTFILLLASVSTLPVGMTAWHENDAGSGGDASDTQANATALTSWNPYMGTLPPGDVDWYAGPNTLPSGACVTLSSFPTVDSDLSLGVGTHLVKSPIPAYQFTTISLAGGPGSLVTAGILVRSENAEDWNAYNETLRVQTASALPPADAGTGQDAGNTRASAIPISAGCFAGRLSPTALDTADVYSFAGQAGQDVVISLSAVTGIPLSIQILDPSGFPLASSTSTSAPLSVSLPSTSTYAVSVSSSDLNGPTDYVLSLLGSGPPGPCRPTCTVS